MSDTPSFSAWWTRETPEGRAQAVRDVAERLRLQQVVRLEGAFRYARMFNGISPDLINSFGTWGLAAPDAVQELGVRRHSINIVRMIVEAAQAKVAETDIRTQPLTTGADDSAQRRARQLQAVSDGLDYTHEMDTEGPHIWRDCAIWGTAMVKLQAGTKGPDVDRVFPYEVMFDDAESTHGKPRQAFHRRLVPREVLASVPAYKKFRTLIATATRVLPIMRTHDSVADLVEVIEAWHLPSGPDVDDGRRMVVLSSGAIVDEPYTRDWLPFIPLHYTRPLVGMWGSGLAEVLEPYQRDLNSQLAALRDSVDAATFKIFIKAGTKIAKAQINNRIAGVVEYAGDTPPAMQETPPLFQQFIEAMQFIINQAFASSGVSQMSAQSIKPAGLDSGEALRTYADQEAGRFSQVLKQYQRWRVKLIDRQIDILREMHEAGTDVDIRSIGEGMLKSIKWSEVGLGSDDYALQLWPANLLSRSPAGRLADVGELMDKQILPPKVAMKLLDMPDLSEELGLSTAALSYADAIIAKMVDDGATVPVDPLLGPDLPVVIDRVRASYERLSRYTKPDATSLSRLRDYLTSAAATVQANSQPPPAPAVPPPSPGAPPMPPGPPQPSPMPPGAPMAPPIQ